MPPHLDWFLGQFYELGSERQVGMAGVGMIPISRIYEAADRVGMVDPDDRERFVALIRACDSAYLSSQRDQHRGGTS